jgi:hypothetical protein
MSTVNARLEGYNEAVQLLKHLPEMMQVKALNRVMIKAAAPAVREARKNVRSTSKRLAQSIKAWTPKRSKSAVVFFGPKKQSLRDLDVRFAHLVEFGASGIKSKNSPGGFRSKIGYKGTDKDLFRMIAARTRVGGRYRSDEPANPYMFPAWQTKSGEVSRIMREDTTALLQKEIKKKAYKI